MNKHEALAASPPISVAGLSLWGITLNDWVLIATLIYTIFLIIDKAPAVYVRVKGWFKKE